MITYKLNMKTLITVLTNVNIKHFLSSNNVRLNNIYDVDVFHTSSWEPVSLYLKTMEYKRPYTFVDCSNEYMNRLNVKKHLVDERTRIESELDKLTKCNFLKRMLNYKKYKNLIRMQQKNGHEISMASFEVVSACNKLSLFKKNAFFLEFGDEETLLLFKMKFL